MADHGEHLLIIQTQIVQEAKETIKTPARPCDVEVEQNDEGGLLL